MSTLLRWILGHKFSVESSGTISGPSSLQTYFDGTAGSSQVESRKRKDVADVTYDDPSGSMGSEVVDRPSLSKRRRLSESPRPAPESFGKFYLWMKDVLKHTHRHSTMPGVCAICLSHSIHRSMYHHVMAEHVFPAMEAMRRYRETPQELFVLLHYILIKSPTTRTKYAVFLSAHQDVLPHTVTAETLISPRHAHPMLYKTARYLSQAMHQARKKRWVCHCGARFRASDKLQKHIMDEKTFDPSKCHFQRRVTFADQRDGFHSAQMRQREAHSSSRTATLALLIGLRL